jgi:hypothetical protein
LKGKCDGGGKYQRYDYGLVSEVGQVSHAAPYIRRILINRSEARHRERSVKHLTK